MPACPTCLPTPLRPRRKPQRRCAERGAAPVYDNRSPVDLDMCSSTRSAAYALGQARWNREVRDARCDESPPGSMRACPNGHTRRRLPDGVRSEWITEWRRLSSAIRGRDRENAYNMPACQSKARLSLGGSSRRPAQTHTRTRVHACTRTRTRTQTRAQTLARACAHTRARTRTRTRTRTRARTRERIALLRGERP